jgi:ubiquinol-cytochrome c reductase iron-sulfur subunit
MAMSNDTVDLKKRAFLTRASQTLGAVAVCGAAVPLVKYLTPGQEAKMSSMPVEFDLTDLSPGDQRTVLWRGKPIWVIRRTLDQVSILDKANPNLSDPNSDIEQQPSYAKNPYRSLRPDILVLVGLCTHLGCAPTFRPEPKAIDEQWPGGFFCSCHGSKFDLAGRVYKGVPAPTNLEVPPYYFKNDQVLVIGAHQP